MRNAINLSDNEASRIDEQIAELKVKRAKVKNQASDAKATILAELKNSRFELPSLNVIWVKPSAAMKRVLPKDVGSQDEFAIPLTDGFSFDITDYGVAIKGKSLPDQLTYIAKQGVPRTSIQIDDNFCSLRYHEGIIRDAKRDQAKALKMVGEVFA